MAEEQQQPYGTYGLMQSGAAFAEKKIEFTPINQLDASLDGKTVWIRGRLHTSRCKGKTCFVSIRHQIYTVQVCGFVNENFTKEMVKFIGGVSKVRVNTSFFNSQNLIKESIVDVEGTVVTVNKPITSCSQSDIELSIKKFFIVSASEPKLPLQIEDATRSDEQAEAANLPAVNLDTRLDNR